MSKTNSLCKVEVEVLYYLCLNVLLKKKLLQVRVEFRKEICDLTSIIPRGGDNSNYADIPYLGVALIIIPVINGVRL